MTKQNMGQRAQLLNRKEIQLVESDFCRDDLFISLRKVSILASKNDALFSLKPAELFYLVIEALDQIKSKQDRQERMDYLEILWQDLKNYMYDKICTKSEEADEYNKAIEFAASLVVNGVITCLRLIDYHRWWYEILKLQENDPEHQRGNGAAMFDIYQDMLTKIAEPQLPLLLKDYMNSDIHISDKIEDDINRLRIEEEAKLLDIELQKGQINIGTNNGVIASQLSAFELSLSAFPVPFAESETTKSITNNFIKQLKNGNHN